MGVISGFLTRRPTPGLWSVTYYPPAIAWMGKTEQLDAFIAVGDGFGQHCMPYSCIRRVWGEVDFPPLKAQPVRVHGSGEGGDGFPTYLSRRANGRHMITERPPVIVAVDGADEVFPQPGDGLFCGDFCKWFAQVVWGLELGLLESAQVTIRGELR